MRDRLFRYIQKKVMPTHFITEIVSGGQTGVDRAALDVAIDLNIPHGGWCPYGRQAEDGIIPTKYKLIEPSQPTSEEKLDSDAIYKKRTELNARDSDGTLIILKEPPVGGTAFTIEMLKKHKKSCFIFYSSGHSKDILCWAEENIQSANVFMSDNYQDVVDWIIRSNIFKMNVAGARASQSSDIYGFAYETLHKILNHPLLNLTQKDTKRVLPRARL